MQWAIFCVASYATQNNVSDTVQLYKKRSFNSIVQRVAFYSFMKSLWPLGKSAATPDLNHPIQLYCIWTVNTGDKSIPNKNM